MSGWSRGHDSRAKWPSRTRPAHEGAHDCEGSHGSQAGQRAQGLAHPSLSGHLPQGPTRRCVWPLADAIADLPSLAAAMEDTAARIAISSAAELKDEEVIEDSALAWPSSSPKAVNSTLPICRRFAELVGGRALIGTTWAWARPSKRWPTSLSILRTTPPSWSAPRTSSSIG